MKKRHLFQTLLFLLISPSLTLAQSLKSYLSTFNGPLKNWAQTFTNFNISDFKPIAPAHQFENSSAIKAKSTVTYYPSYKTALSISPNSAYALNIYSYLLLEKQHGKFTTTGSDVEQSILLGNLAKRKWQKIAYYSYAQRAQEVQWINSDTFILAAARLDGTGKNRPVIIIGHIKAKSFTNYETTDPACYQKPIGYESPKLTALHIQKAQ